MQRPDLWHGAFDKLSDDELKRLGVARPFTGNQVKTSLSKIRDRVQEYQASREKRSWRITLSGREINLRNVSSKIIKWVHEFEKIGSSIMQYDPGHAALPWAGLCFLITAVKASEEQFDFVLRAAEAFSHSILHGALYEDLAARLGSLDIPPGRKSQIDQLISGFLESIEKHYDMVLGAMLAVSEITTASRAKRYRNAVLPSFRHGLSYLDDLEKHAHELDRQGRQLAIQESQSFFDDLIQRLNDLEEPFQDLKNTQKQTFLKIEEQEFTTILEWCSKIHCGDHHRSIADHRLAGTGDWLIEHIVSWKKANSSTFLLLYGPPGIGKSFLMSRLVDWARELASSCCPTEVFAYFYCNHEDETRRRAKDILASYVRQLIGSSSTCFIHPDVHATYLKLVKESRTLDLGSSRDLLLAMVKSQASTILYLDALDECGEEEREKILFCLGDLAGKTEKPLKIIVSSRPEPDIVQWFDKHAKLELQGPTMYNDISLFIDHKISYSKLTKLDEGTRDIIKSTMLDKGHGMFLWVSLQFCQLLRPRILDTKGILKTLESMPSDLTKAYDQMYAEIERLPKCDKNIAKRALFWVLCNGHSMEQSWLLTAVSIDPDSDEPDERIDGLDAESILSLCKYFLVLDGQQCQWRFVHLSAIEYLQGRSHLEQEANRLVASASLKVLIDRRGFLRAVHKHLCGNTLNSYPGNCFCDLLIRWGHSARASRDAGEPLNEQLLGRILSFFGIREAEQGITSPYEAMAQIIRVARNPEYSFVQPPYTGLGRARRAVAAACVFGFWEVIIWCLESQQSEMYRSELLSLRNNESALSVAALYGYEQACHTLLDLELYNADLLAESLSFAAENRLAEVTRRLVAVIPDINVFVRRPDALALKENPAVSGGYKIHLPLLDIIRGLDENAALGIMKKLVPGKADVNLVARRSTVDCIDREMAKLSIRLNAMNIAISRGYVKITEFLAKNGASLPEASEAQGLARILRSTERYDMVLSGKIPNHTPTQQDKDCALVYEAKHGFTSQVLTLLANGANMSISVFDCIDHGRMKGNCQSILETLLDAVPESCDRGFSDCLSASLCTAIKQRCQPCCMLLLNRGADTNQGTATVLRPGTSPTNMPPLELAVRTHNSPACIALIAHGADLNPTSSCSPLNLAVRALNPYICITLLRAGADVNRQCSIVKETPLATAATMASDSSVCKLLVQEGAEVDLTFHKGTRSPLQSAVTAGQVNSTYFLLHAGADPDLLLTGNCPTALWALIASMDRRVNVERPSLMSLLGIRADPDLKALRDLYWNATWRKEVVHWREGKLPPGITFAGCDKRLLNELVFECITQLLILEMLLRQGAKVPQPLYADLSVPLPPASLGEPGLLAKKAYCDIVKATISPKGSQPGLSPLLLSQAWVLWHLVHHDPRTASTLLCKWGITKTMFPQIVLFCRFRDVFYPYRDSLGVVYFRKRRWKVVVLWDGRIDTVKSNTYAKSSKGTHKKP